ncbi:MAG TPA: hypothetical protein VNF05_03805 [Acidimicrobiales bacterium]|nr:hypothetical protein [Acidimicrobiales bacterium]
MIWFAAAALGVSVVGVIVAVNANKRSREANALSRDANTIAGEAKDAAVKSAGEASKSAEEARKSRLENLASSVTIKNIEPHRERWIIDSKRETEEMTHPGICEPNTTFHLPISGAGRILVGAMLTLANEGNRTAEVDFDVNRLDDVTSEGDYAAALDKYNAATWRDQSNSVRRNRKVSVAPHTERRVFVRSGPTFQEWLDGGEPPVWITQVSITSHVAVAAAIQRWILTLSAQLLTTDPQYQGQVRTLSNTLIGADLQLLSYGYPDDPRASHV